MSMGMLFRYEMKKLFSRKLVWIAMALCAALQIINCYGEIRLALGGAVSGMKEVYARYDGQTFTDKLKARMLADYREYAAAHPEEFKPSEMDPAGYWALDEQAWQRRHGYGVMLAYQDLQNRQTWEEIEKEWQTAKNGLASSTDAEGDPLSPSLRRWYMRLTSHPPYTPVVRYDLGWTMGSDSPMLVDAVMQRAGLPMVGYAPMSLLLLLLLLLIGLPGFAGERGARMEPVLVTCARRSPAVLAKLLAVVSAIAATALILSLLHLLLRFATFGLSGWYLPSGPFGLGAGYLISWAVGTLGFVLGCAAGAVIITALSAPARHGVSALLLAIASLAAQYGLWMLSQPLNSVAMSNGWAKALYDAASALPLSVIGSLGFPYGLLPYAGQVAALFALPLALCAACLLFAPKIYLRRRKA